MSDIFFLTLYHSKGLRLTWLSHTYNKIVDSTGISKRADFRVRVIC